MKVLMLGATGLTGSHCLEMLLNAPEVKQVIAPVRRSLGREHPVLDERLVDFDQLDADPTLFQVDAVVCCLGTTIKKAGSRAAFRHVDFELGYRAGCLAREQGASGFFLMSAVGASDRSPVFYNRVKGELETALRELRFPRLVIYRPSLLLGERQEHRAGEATMAKAMPVINRVLAGPLSRYRGITVQTVARAMVADVRQLDGTVAEQPEVLIRHYHEMAHSGEPS